MPSLLTVGWMRLLWCRDRSVEPEPAGEPFLSAPSTRSAAAQPTDKATQLPCKNTYFLSAAVRYFPFFCGGCGESDGEVPVIYRQKPPSSPRGRRPDWVCLSRCPPRGASCRSGAHDPPRPVSSTKATEPAGRAGPACPARSRRLRRACSDQSPPRAQLITHTECGPALCHEAPCACAEYAVTCSLQAAPACKRGARGRRGGRRRAPSARRSVRDVVRPAELT